MKLQELLALTCKELAKNEDYGNSIKDFKHKDKLRRFEGMRDHEALFHITNQSDEFYEIMSQKMDGHYTADEIKTVADFFLNIKKNRLGEGASFKKSGE